MNKETVECSPLLLKCLVTQWLVHVSFISVTEVFVTHWLVHVSFISVTEVFVTHWLVHVSFISVTEVFVTQWTCGLIVHVSLSL